MPKKFTFVNYNELFEKNYRKNMDFQPETHHIQDVFIKTQKQSNLSYIPKQITCCNLCRKTIAFYWPNVLEEIYFKKTMQFS